MINTLVVIGHHKEEVLFGNLLKELMEKDGDTGISFYPVVKSYTNNRTCTQEEILAAYQEIYKTMWLDKPNITIDVHTSDDGANGWWGAELFSLLEYEKMISLERASTNPFPVMEEGIYVPHHYPDAEKFPILKQKEFPYVVLEKYLIPDKHCPPFLEQLGFTAEVIREISEMYKMP